MMSFVFYQKRNDLLQYQHRAKEEKREIAKIKFMLNNILAVVLGHVMVDEIGYFQGSVLIHSTDLESIFFTLDGHSFYISQIHCRSLFDHHLYENIFSMAKQPFLLCWLSPSFFFLQKCSHQLVSDYFRDLQSKEFSQILVHFYQSRRASVLEKESHSRVTVLSKCDDGQEQASIVFMGIMNMTEIDMKKL